MKNFIEKIKEKKVRINVIGLGYVGLPLCVEFARSGFTVEGIDVSEQKTKAIASGKSYIGDVTDKDLSAVVKSGLFTATTDFKSISKSDVVIICVPTPLRKTRDPDLSYIISAVDKIAQYIKKGTLIVLESTTYPGTCEEIILPVIEAEGLKIGKDFWLAFSPERVDPGNEKFVTKNIPKVIGGTTPQCTKAASLLYSSALSKVHPVSSTTVAEMVKLLENTFRSVNIGLVNEMAMLCKKMNVDVWEVIDGAASKPFGFMPFYPGPGLGGHCIPIDPLYLSWKAKTFNFDARFIELASLVNGIMPFHVVDLIAEALNEKKKCVKGANILVMGVAYKKNVTDIRESPALEVISRLIEKGARICFDDPGIDDLRHEGIEGAKHVRAGAKQFKAADCVVILTDHSCYDYTEIVKNSSLVVDTRNATRDVAKKYRSKIIRL